MGYRYLVVGAGMQGTAAAHDLAAHGDAALVTVVDRDPGRASAAAARISALVPGVEIASGVADASDIAALGRLFSGHDAALSALPYRFNLAATRAAVAGGCHLNDLGGNTGIVREQLALDREARSAGVSVVPDCGLAPGLGNLLVVYGLARFPGAEEARIRCGGLPQHPKGPLDYMLVFSAAGLANEYMGEAEVLRDGQPAREPTFTGHERLQLPAPVGEAEAFYTSGGISTLTETLAGRLKHLDYKTIRYPGHYEKMKAMIGLGLLDTEPIELGGPNGRQRVVPRELFQRLVETRLSFPGEPDLVVLRVELQGRGEAGDRHILRMDMLDRQDERTGFTAMERTTAYPAAMVTARQARGEVKPGAHRLEEAFDVVAYVEELGRHGLRLEESWA